MDKEFVTYKQALALTKLGFVGPAMGLYYEKGKELYYGAGSFSSRRHENILAPLYSEAFRWFREKHKLIAYPQWRIDDTWDMTIQQLDGHGLLSGQATLSVIKKSTYEEAEQACLDKLIKIVKDGKTNKTNR